MPTFQITAPDGKKYRITGETAEGAYEALQQHIGSGGAGDTRTDAAKGLDDYYSKGIYAGEYNPLGAVARSVDAFASGAQAAPLFGWGDEIAGAVLPGDTAANQEALQGRNEALRESNPVASISGEIAGSALGARGLARFGLLPSAQLAPTASMAARVGAGMAEGGVLGALYGAGSAESGERTSGALVGGGLGAALGGAVPLVAQGVSSAYRSIADRLSRNEVARQAGVDPSVAAQLAQTLDADGTLGTQGRANMAAAGQEAMLADAGPNARAVLDTAIQRGGPGAVLARSRIDERVGRDAASLTQAMDNALGQPQGVTATRTAIREGSAGARSDAYTRAYAQPIDYAAPAAREIEDLVRTRVPASAIRRANELMRLEGQQSRQILANIGDDGTVMYEALPDVRQLDYITRALNDVASEANGQGTLGGTTALGRAYEGLSSSIRGRLRDLVPEYGEALRTAADPIRRSQAVELGSQLLSPTMRRDQLAEAVEGFSAAERDALAQGVRSQIDDTVANVTRTIQDGNLDAREAYKALRDLSSRANREKLTTALGEERARPLFDELDRVAQSFNLRASVTENSKTFARQATNNMVEGLTAPGPVGKAAQGEPIKATKSIVQLLTGQTPERMTARQDAIYSQIADYLTRPAQQAIPAFQAMQNFQGQTVANQARAAQIARLLLEGRFAAYPGGGQLGTELRK
jgi:hypothetical protein